jgi:hypothetical protein
VSAGGVEEEALAGEKARARWAALASWDDEAEVDVTAL